MYVLATNLSIMKLMTLKSKLNIAFFAIALVTLLAGILNSVTIWTVNSSVTDFAQHDALALLALGNINESASRMSAESLSVFLILSEEEYLPVTGSGKNQALQEASEESQELDESYAEAQQWVLQYEQVSHNPNRETIARQLEDALEEIQQQAQTLIGEKLNLIRGAQILETKEALEEAENDLNRLLSTALEAEQAHFRATQTAVEQNGQRAITLNILLVVVSIIGAIYLGFLVSRYISTPIMELTNVATQIGQGKWNTPLPKTNQDEIGILATTLQEMVHNLQETTVSKGYVDNILQSMGEALLVLDTNEQIILANRASEQLFGYKEADLYGQPLSILLQDKKAFQKFQQDWITHTQHVGQVEVMCVGRNGRSIPTLLAATIMLEGERATNIICTFTDITIRKQAEHTMRQAKEAAEEANRAKSAFLANMSHELRTPLAAMIGYNEMLEELTDADKQHGYARILRKSITAGNHLLNLINNILDISKIEAGKSQTACIPFDLGLLLNEITTTAIPLVQTNNNRLMTDYDPQIGQMVSDATKLQQILLNLLGNAAKFTQDGTITLLVRPHQEQIKFLVKDTGIGMTPEQTKKVFGEIGRAHV